MNKSIQNSAIRFVLLWALQVLVLKHLYWDWDGQAYLQAHAYVLFIMLLPFNSPRSLTVLLGFIMGLSVDFFYESPGVHTATLTFTAYIRSLVFTILTPREGYNIKDYPTKNSLGDVWFLKYTSLLMLFHLFFYYAVEAFTFVYIGSILLKTFFSWLASVFFILLIVYITNPKE